MSLSAKPRNVHDVPVHFRPRRRRRNLRSPACGCRPSRAHVSGAAPRRLSRTVARFHAVHGGGAARGRGRATDARDRGRPARGRGALPRRRGAGRRDVPHVACTGRRPARGRDTAVALRRSRRHRPAVAGRAHGGLQRRARQGGRDVVRSSRAVRPFRRRVQDGRRARADRVEGLAGVGAGGRRRAAAAQGREGGVRGRDHGR